MNDRYTIRDGIVYGISRDPKKGTEVRGLLILFGSDPQALADLMNLCHCEGEQKGMADARKIIFGTPDGELAVSGAIANIFDVSGGINQKQQDELDRQDAERLAGIPENDDHFDDCPMGVGGECDCVEREQANIDKINERLATNRPERIRRAITISPPAVVLGQGTSRTEWPR